MVVLLPPPWWAPHRSLVVRQTDRVRFDPVDPAHLADERARFRATICRTFILLSTEGGVLRSILQTTPSLGDDALLGHLQWVCVSTWKHMRGSKKYRGMNWNRLNLASLNRHHYPDNAFDTLVWAHCHVKPPANPSNTQIYMPRFIHPSRDGRGWTKNTVQHGDAFRLF